jgi:phosphatidate cytidylyltransferase
VLRARLATAAVAIPLLLALIFWAPAWGWAAVVGAVAVLALVEYVGLAFAERPGARAVGLLLGLPVIGAALIQPRPGPVITAALSLLIAGGLSYAVLARRDLERGLLDIGLLTIGVLYAGLLLPHFYWLRVLPEGPQWATLVIAIGMAGDSGGYFVGHAFGRHKLIPHVSPGKTVEGALGIVVCSVVAGAVGKLVLLPGRSWREMLMLSLVMAVIGQVGDLGESVMKRSFGAKESGKIFPGHGGVLDRIDSLLFPVTLVYYYLILSAGPGLES